MEKRLRKSGFYFCEKKERSKFKKWMAGLKKGRAAPKKGRAHSKRGRALRPQKTG